MSHHIEIAREARVVTITINRQDKKNALTQEMYGVLADTLVAYGENNDERALVITGAGEMFTAGNDLGDFAKGDREKEVPPVWRFLNAIRDCPKPVIAAVNGPAIGVGLTMLLHCDLVYAGRAATFAAPFVKLGVVPEAGSSVLLPAAVGMAMANDILLAGRVLNADEALKVGLISRVFDADVLIDEVGKIAMAMSMAAPTSMKLSKGLIRDGREALAEHMAVEAKLFASQLQGPEFAESVAAMAEKRLPDYG
ncbi:enoyl-CoA hydratase-related protein [Alisedimentitalea sp. MJ-SS2]|uniref:enoyl-CoA hydratase-related protein n=1 Tax=Aliisedimentitalea sp. MJ-SS2 TaxID=3049795 RepID=UPI00290E4A61|nr:enoyl-CoA hydratase-related protein [Alisedimentitalea sp. MJ-SS2]MDU8928995.1 enoyl-CoA hydratase-related protein [Alisedimentitalea sp. MJ-SS2]